MTTSAVPATPAQWYAQDLIRFQSGPRGSGPRYRYTSVQRLATGFQMTRDTIANIQTKFLDPAIARHNLHRTRPDQPCPSRERTKPAIDEIKRQFPQLMDPRVDATWRERAFHSWILSRLDNFERRKGGIRAKGTKTANGWSSQASSFGTPASGLTPTPSALDVSNPQHQTMTRHNLSLTQTPPYQPESIQQPSEAGSTTWAPPSLLTMVMHFTRPAIPMEDGEEVEADTAAFLLHHCAEREDLHDLGAEAVLMSVSSGAYLPPSENTQLDIMGSCCQSFHL